MSVVIGSLVVSLGLDSARFQTGAVKAQTQMKGLQSGVMNLQRVAGGFNLRGVTQQLSQVAQMAAATGQPVRALAVQLPDLALGFGPLGIAIGAVAGLTLPLLTDALFGASEEVATLQERAEALAAAVKAFQDASEAAQVSTAELRGEFGSLATEADRALGALERLAQGEAERAMRENIAAISAEFGDLASAVIEVDDIVGQFTRDRALGSFMEALEIPEGVVAEAEALAQALVDMGAAEGAAEQAAAFQAALDALTAAKGPLDAMEGSAADLATRLAEGVLEAGRMQGAIEDTGFALVSVIQGANQLAAGLAAAQGPAAGLLGTMQGLAAAAWNAASALAAQDAAADAGRAATAALGDDERGGDTGNIQDAIDMQRRADAVERYGAALTGVARAAGGSGGAAAAIEEVADISEVLSDILADAGDPLADFRDGLASVAEDGFGGMGDALRDFTASGLTDFEAFGDALVSTAADAVADVTAEFVALQSASLFGSFAGPFGGLIGGLAGGLFESIFGGGGQPYEGSEQEAIDQEKAALIQQQHELMGHENYLREQEILAYDESNQDLARHVQELEAEAEAAAEAAQAAADLAAQQEAIAAQALSLDEQWLALIGDTEALRQLQLEQMDESLWAMQEQIWAEQDRQAAIEGTTQAIEEAVAALSTDDFATDFAYRRAVALTQNGVITPGMGYIPPPANVATAPATAQNDPMLIEMRTMNARVLKLEQRSFKWDTEGLPQERDYA